MTVPSGSKLTIKKLKRRAVEGEYAERQWSKLEEAIKAVQRQQAVQYNLEELYRAVEELCQMRPPEKLYTQVQELTRQHVDDVLRDLASAAVALEAQGSDALLTRVDQMWAAISACMLHMRQICLHLDRSYVMHLAPTTGVTSLYDMGLGLLQAGLGARDSLQGSILAAMLHLIQCERQGEAISVTTLRSCTLMWRQLSLYTATLEPALLQQTEAWYQQQSRRQLETLHIADYLEFCESSLEEEARRSDEFLHGSSRAALLRVVEEQTIVAHLDTIHTGAFPALLRQPHVEGLQRLYRLWQRVERLPVLRDAFKAAVKSEGGNLLDQFPKEPGLIEALLELKGRLERVVSEAFANDSTFAAAHRDATESFINSKGGRPAEMLAKYIDGLLRKDKKDKSGKKEDEVEAGLDNALTLFRHIQGKDIFEAFYKRDLAKRLLLGISANSDAEKSMLSKLKTECGAHFTSKLEGMFRDMELSNDLNAAFEQDAQAQKSLPSGLSLHVSVLTQGFWPSYPIHECRLPPVLHQAQSAFKDFYARTKEGRNITWYHSLAQCTIRTDAFQYTEGRGSYTELATSLHQALVLCLYNDHDQLTFAEIWQATELDKEELKRTLLQLSNGRFVVLARSGDGKEIDDGEFFALKLGMKVDRRRIKLNHLQLKETSEENKKTNEQVEQDRQHLIDAAIVRTMKTRKTLSHHLLMSELGKQLKFTLRNTDVKKRIESLIEREYLERDPNDKDVYKYLA